MWNKEIKFYPKDDFSNEMLRTIPVKIAAWLKNCDIEATRGRCGDLYWNFEPLRGTILLGPSPSVTSNDGHIQIFWEMTDEKPVFSGSDPRFQDLRENLDFFVAFETSVYKELETYLIPNDDTNISTS